MNSVLKTIAQLVVLWVVGSYVLTYTLSWFSGQPRLPYSTVLFSDGLSCLVIYGCAGAIGLLVALFKE